MSKYQLLSVATHVIPLTMGLVAMLVPKVASAETLCGAFVDEVVFLVGEDFNAPNVIGPPTGSQADLNGGAATVRIGEDIVSFDYGVPVPAGTDLIVIESGGNPDPTNDPLPTVAFGYADDLVDSNKDGLPENSFASAVLLDWVFLGAPVWDLSYPARLHFFDLDHASQPFTGLSPSFFVVVDDPPGGDLDLDAVQVIPEPSAALLLGLSALALFRRPNI